MHLKDLPLVMKWHKDLALKQVDDALSQYASLSQLSRPSGGWLNAVRTALGMSARALGERVGLSQPRIALIERGEVDGSISLKTLERAAQGLGCRVVYVLVPEEGSLAAMRERQALRKAQALNQYAERHMELEEQATADSFRQESTRELASELLRTWPRDFWDDR
jgi:predicted DNA-binding mobile mystery protein A